MQRIVHRRSPRPTALAGLGAAVLLLHALVLRECAQGAQAGPPRAVALTAIEVRHLAAPAGMARQVPPALESPLQSTLLPAASPTPNVAVPAAAATPLLATPAAAESLAGSGRAGPQATVGRREGRPARPAPAAPESAAMEEAPPAAGPLASGAAVSSARGQGGAPRSAAPQTAALQGEALQTAALQAATPQAAPVQTDAPQVATGQTAAEQGAAARPEPLPSAGAVSPAAREGAQPLQLALAAAESAEPAEAGPPPEVPVYATRIPRALQWRYRLQRGFLSGEGALRWTPPVDGVPYEARLEGRIAGLTVLDWRSEGRADAAGIAPERFVIRRRGRDAQAANFQRAAGKITYSGPRVEYPLLPGAQDRLSWMLQLPAILQAAPQRFSSPGASISLFVSGARGDADVWVFRLAGAEEVELPGAPLRALKFLREPRKPHDTRVEVWLAPAQSYLPVRARLTSGNGAEVLELVWQPD